MKVLVIAAHPDDEVLGVGPLIVQLAGMGDQVDVMCFTENSVRHGNAASDSLNSLLACTKALGVNNSWFHGLQDQSLDMHVFTDLVSRIEEALNDQEYDIVLTHSEFDLNRDHRVLSEATRVAARGRDHLNLLAEYQSVSSSEHQFGGRFEPTMFLEVSHAEVGKAWYAFADSYPKEVCLHPHPRSVQSYRAHFSNAGMVIRKEFAVPLRIIRMTGMFGAL